MGSNPGGCKRCSGRKRHEQCFCFRCRIFCAHLSWIRNLCLFLFIWISVQFWTSEPICLFFVRSASAVLLFPLCTALPALPGLGPGNRCLQLYLGAEPEGLDPYCYCMFYYYYYYIIIILLFVQWESMAALWREHGKMMKFGTLVEMVMNSYLTNFGVSRTTSIAPPPVQNSTLKWL